MFNEILLITKLQKTHLQGKLNKQYVALSWSVNPEILIVKQTDDT